MEPRAFVFTSVSATGNWRTGFKIWSAFNGTWGLLNAYCVVRSFLARLRLRDFSYEERWVMRMGMDLPPRRRQPSETGSSSESLCLDGVVNLGDLLRGLCCCCQMQNGVAPCILIVLATELLIKWNRLEGLENISSSGQIVSLTVGSMSLIRAIGLIIIGGREPQRLDAATQSSDRDIESQLPSIRSSPF